MITKRERLRVAKPVVLIAEELSPATVGVLGSDFDIRHCDGANRDELLAALKSGVDAVLIRSATKMDAEAISAATGLRVIARAGVGLDNVDIPAATAAKVLVINAPTSNIVSAAELAIALMMASARNISPAHASLRAGKWARSKFSGTEMFEKTLGIVGFGNIGKIVAKKLSGLKQNSNNNTLNKLGCLSQQKSLVTLTCQVLSVVWQKWTSIPATSFASSVCTQPLFLPYVTLFLKK
jgi:D-3-phosphoglycerate dehydrogenase